MSCLSNQIWFTKGSAKFIPYPCRLSFEKRADIFVAFIDEIEGFKIRIGNNGFAINSRPLIAAITKLFKTAKPKFKIVPTINPQIFELQLIKS